MRYLAIGALCLAACHHAVAVPPPLWPEADALFHTNPRWLGADAALSIPLGADRTLWLFGDTFVATSAAHLRSESKMVHNTIGVESGLDPTHATVDLLWRDNPDGSPASYFPEDGERYMWPGHGVRIGSRVILFLMSQRATNTGGVFGFAHAGDRVAILDGVDRAPSTWTLSTIDLPDPGFDASVGTAVVATADSLVAVAVRNAGDHVGYLVRWPLTDVAANVFTNPAWWNGSAWVPPSALASLPAVVLDDAGPECSVHFDTARARWVHVYTRGFGASQVSIHTAPALEGPWSAPIDLFTPPESAAPNAFVYAAKAHPELDAGGQLVISYATNSFDFGTLVATPGLYYPLLARVDLSAY